MASQEQQFEDQSLWRPWCVGVVVEDKPFGTNSIRVSPLERMTDPVGEIKTFREKFEKPMPKATGGHDFHSVEGSKVYTADWVPNGDNHLFTSPMVYRNETVMLYRYADTTDVYWTTLFREPGLRKLERFIFAASDIKGKGTMSLNNTYYIDFNTLDKWIEIRTNDSDGEEFNYRFKIDAGESRVTLEDNIGNRVILDSPTNNVFMEDASGGLFETRDGWPRIYGPKGIVIETPEQVFINSGNILTVGPVVNTDLVTNNSDTITIGFAAFPGGHTPC